MSLKNYTLSTAATAATNFYHYVHQQRNPMVNSKSSTKNHQINSRVTSTNEYQQLDDEDDDEDDEEAADTHPITDTFDAADDDRPYMNQIGNDRRRTIKTSTSASAILKHQQKTHLTNSLSDSNKFRVVVSAIRFSLNFIFIHGIFFRVLI